ncbi:MAG: NifU family protein [Patescibacteria group bacterium]|jgi:Fe-S cluster biogenesis protein NfuA|nr:NifU family protein [Patescibacteria group bacterium]
MDIKKQINDELEKIRPQLQMDGGDVEFVDFNEKTGVLIVSLVGMCATCPMSQITLKQGIEATIVKAIPQVTEVINA